MYACSALSLKSARCVHIQTPINIDLARCKCCCSFIIAAPPPPPPPPSWWSLYIAGLSVRERCGVTTPLALVPEARDMTEVAERIDARAAAPSLPEVSGSGVETPLKSSSVLYERCPASCTLSLRRRVLEELVILLRVLPLLSLLRVLFASRLASSSSGATMGISWYSIPSDTLILPDSMPADLTSAD